VNVLAVLDTTVLVAGLTAAHPEHAACRLHLQAAAGEPGTYRCTTHAIAETFRVLTALPVNPRLDTAGARIAIRASLIPRLDPLPLTVGDYERALDIVCVSGLGAGAVYDCLHLLAAERLGSAYLITSNLKHLRRLAEAADITVQVVDPSDPAPRRPV